MNSRRISGRRLSPSEKFFGEREAKTGNAPAFRRLEVTKLKKKNENDKTHKQVRTAVICADLEKNSPLIGIHNLFVFSLYNFSLNILTSHKDQLVGFFYVLISAWPKNLYSDMKP